MSICIYICKCTIYKIKHDEFLRKNEKTTG